MSKGRQIFWVCPLVDFSEAIEAKSAKEQYEVVKADYFPNHEVGILHGQMKSSESRPR